jgi:hypothetical protein
MPPEFQPILHDGCYGRRPPVARKPKASLDETPADFFSWGAVHGGNAAYTRMALCLAVVDQYFSKPGFAAPCTAYESGRRQQET